MPFLSRVAAALGIKTEGGGNEGQYRDGPYYLPVSGGWLSADAGQWDNWWQMGYNVQPGGPDNAIIEACVSAYSQTVAMCPGNHWYWTEKEGRERITTSALCRILRLPNSYQSISDFLLNMVRDLYLSGNAYALALRNSRYEITELHRMQPRLCAPQIATNGEVFYNLAGNDVIDRQIGSGMIVPARDVLHIRLHTPEHPLIGETPLAAAALQQAAGDAALRQQVQFFTNRARPSFVLTTDKILTADQVREIRERWNEQSKGMNKGGTPILTAGLKAEKIGVSNEDSQLVELLGLGNQAIANVYRVPLQLLGLGNTTYSSTEALMAYWLASGLGFALNHIEEAIGNMFRLAGQPDEYLEFDTSALLRSAFKDRVEAWSSGTKGGIFARNEARGDFEMPPVEGGDEPWVQQQDVPLSVAFENANNPPPPPTPAPTPPAGGEPPANQEDGADAERAYAWHSQDIDARVARNLAAIP